MSDRPSWTAIQNLPGNTGYVVMIPENGSPPSGCRYVPSTVVRY
jgi:hypothetical protein